MSDRPDLARAATDALSREVTNVPASAPAREAAMIQALASAIDSRARARRRRRTLFAAAGVSALVAGAVLFLRGTEPSPRVHVLDGDIHVMRSGRASLVDGDFALRAGDRVSSGAAAHASVQSTRGTRLSLDPNTDFSVDEHGARRVFALKRGSVRAEVAKLVAGERFIIYTSDVEVEVKGTMFSVTVVPPDASCRDGVTTRVDVTEGIVAVRSHGREDLVTAGASWPAECVARPLAREITLADETREPAPPAALTTIPPTDVAAPPAKKRAHVEAATLSATSDLAAQNRLFQEAATAKRRGDTKSAIGIFDDFLAKYPSSDLAESAQVERMRLLPSLSPARAKEAARQYLVAHPQGSARDEARAILARPD